jgi:phage baseplate assembly protein W
MGVRFNNLMMLGSTLQFPVSPDQRGTFGVIATDEGIVTQAIIDLIETRQGERKMLPNYGIPDLIFDVLDSSFAARLAFFVEQQIRNYVRAVEEVEADAGALVELNFIPSVLPSPHKAAIRVKYTMRGTAVPQELIYPTWRLLKQ